MRFASTTTVLLLAGLLLSPSPAFADASPEDLFRQGREAIVKRDWPAAHQALLQSWALKKSFDTATLLGQTELKLGKHRDAAEHFAYALRNFPNRDPKPDAKKRVEEGLKAAREKVSALRVEVSPAGAEVRVGGKSVGRAPLEHELYVEPGTHFVEVSLDGYDTEKREVVARAGGEEGLRIELAKKAAGAAPAAGPAPPQGNGGKQAPSQNGTGGGGTRDDSSTKTTVLIAEGVVAAIGLGVGVGYLLAKSSAEDDRDRLKQRSITEVGANGCASQPDASVCVDLEDAADRARKNATISTVGFVGAGVAVIGLGATWLLWPSPKSGGPRVGFDPMRRSVMVTGQF